MALKIVGNISGFYTQKVLDTVYMTNSEAGVVGTAYKLSSNRWTKAVDADRIYAICRKATTASTDVLGYMELVKGGDIIEADYTGTPDAAFIVGQEACSLGDSDGLNVDAADITGGHLIMLKKDTVNAKILCIAVKNFCNAS
jgi:hypothetical protein